MTALEWKKQTSPAEAAALLRRVADAIEGDGAVRLDEGGWELDLDVPDELKLELEVELEDGGTELEIELSWGGAGAAAAESES